MSSLSAYSCHNKAWRQHKAELRGFLVNRAGGAAEADDLLQDVFLKALQQGKDFCLLENPRAWLFHVARNLLIDRLRLTREQVPLPEDLGADAETAIDPVDSLVTACRACCPSCRRRTAKLSSFATCRG
jgi:RNA polymerase sigma-70 factor (ECF subfamily)